MSEKAKTSSFSSFRDGSLGPSVILVIICLICTLILAGTYQVTKPTIEHITKVNADAARSEVLPDGAADGFTEMDVTPVNSDITEIYKANNGSGIVCTAVVKGFSSGLTVMTGIDSEGHITGVKITSHAETPGLGTKAMTDEHLGLFKDQTSITMTDEADKTQIDAVTGATYSSKGIFNAVNDALLQFAEIGGAL